jgi:hypothetical protein
MPSRLVIDDYTHDSLKNMESNEVIFRHDRITVKLESKKRTMARCHNTLKSHPIAPRPIKGIVFFTRIRYGKHIIRAV